MFKVTAIVSKKTNRLSLIQGQDYIVIGIEDSDFRIIDEAGEPTLYPKNYFLDTDEKLPKDWILKKYDDGEYTCNPPELSGVGFYEDYADGNISAKEVFKTYCKKIGLENNQGV